MKKNEFLFSMGKLVNKAKHEHVFQQGDKGDSLYLLKTGLFNAYYLTIDGKEFVKSVILPGSFSRINKKRLC